MSKDRGLRRETCISIVWVAQYISGGGGANHLFSSSKAVDD